MKGYDRDMIRIGNATYYKKQTDLTIRQLAARAALFGMPADRRILAERKFDEMRKKSGKGLDKIA